MINVSSAFKTAMKAESKELLAYITDGTTQLTEADDLKGVSIKSEGTVMQTILRGADISFFGNHNFLDKEINIGIGVKTSSGNEYIDYGKFVVYEQKTNIETGVTTIRCYDKMYKALKLYEAFDFIYPYTIKELLEEICERLGYQLGTTDFFNKDVVISTDVFNKQDTTYRMILDWIAEATCSTVCFGVDDKLKLVPVMDTAIDTITTNELMSLGLKEKWGPVNSVSLAQNPIEEDFVYRGGYEYGTLLLENGEEMLLENDEVFELEVLQEIQGLYQMRISNNPILVQDRELFIDDIADIFIGYEVEPFDISTIFLGYYEVGDKVKVKDLSDVEHTGFITSVSLSVGDGNSESISSTIPVTARDNYRKEAGVIKRTIMSSQIGSENIENEAITNEKIENEAITNEKIKELSVDKLTAGSLKVGTEIIIPDEEGNAIIYIANVP